METVESVFLRILEGLRADPDNLVPLEGQDGKGEASGEALLWTRLFLARHYDRLGQTGKAPTYPPCTHTPTITPLLLFQMLV